MVEPILGALPEGWAYTTLGKACDEGGGGVQTGPFGSQLHASDYVDEGIPSIMPANIGDNRIVEEGIARITETDAIRLEKYRVRTGDIVYSRRGDVERRALVRPHESGWLCGTGCLRVRLGEKGHDPVFTSYYLGHPKVRQWIVRHAQGATMANLNTTILSNLPFVEAPFDSQRAIAKILGDLDDKIDLLREMNRTLEEIARALFRAWFVDFEPIRTKAAGAASFRGTPQRLFDELPDSFTASEVGDIPTGWMVEPIGSLADCVGGGTPSTGNPAFWENGVHPFCTPKDMSSMSSMALWDTERHLTDAGAAKVSSGSLPVGTVLLSSRAPIGYIAMNFRPVSINQGIIAMKPTILPKEFLRFWLEANMETIKANAGGTTFAEISKSKFRPILAIRPQAGALSAYSDLTRGMLERVATNELEAQKLAALRDALLPKLISGELPAPDFETLGLTETANGG